MNTKSTILALTVYSFAATLLVPNIAVGESLLLEEVLITATRRNESLQDVSVSASAFNSKQLKELNLDTVGDMANYSPNVEFKRLWGSKGTSSLFFIRGLGQADFNEGSESPATVYVDDFYIISPSAADFLLFDAERSEILRGPQGTLFGRNSTAGAVSIFNNTPDVTSDRVGGEASLHFGGDERREVIGVINIPLIKNKLAARFGFDLDEMGAYTENLFPGTGPGAVDKNETDFQAYRGALQYETDKVILYLKGSYGKFDANSTGDQALPVQFGAEGIVDAPADAFGYSGTGDPDTVNTDSSDRTVNEIYHVLFRADYQLNEQTSLKWITGWFDQDKLTLEDFDGTPRTIGGHIRQQVEQDYWTQEIRVNHDTDSARWTFGAFYLDQDYFNTWNSLVFSGTGTNEALGDQTAAGGPDFSIPGTPGGQIFILPNTIERKSYAAYAHVEYELSEELSLSVGARWNKEESDAEQNIGVYFHDFPDTGRVTIDGQTFGYISLGMGDDRNLIDNHLVSGSTAAFPFKYDDDFINYKVQADWRPNEDILLYTSFRKGSKAGGTQNGFVNTVGVFDKETNNAYEIGAKWSPLSWARINGALFYYDYEDYQASAFDGNQVQTGTIVLNKDATVSGAEVEATLAPLDGLDLKVGVGYVDTEVEDIANVAQNPAGNIISNRKLGQAPDLQFSALARYSWAVGVGDMAVQIDYSWIDERFVDVLNDEATKLDGYGLTNASVAFSEAEDKWFARLYVKNLWDKRGETQKFNLVGLGGVGQVNYTLPRQYGLEFGVRF